ncbi:GAF and ANTAR domain-containing protein [Kribbella turkmenica]|uniref:GAF and ANTAR domain-containing protein n=1 Tax=Kribbella turkmenica TaxID=2530375 RepID=UPI001F3854B7|nr:GAF and ANTAR domain-containing protein [Kribbella turkmenica]
MEHKELIEVVTGVADTLRAPINLDEALDRITGSAVETIPGISYASLSVTTKGGQIRTVAPTDPLALRADELQYEFQQGPCFEAVVGAPIVQSDDLANDRRWPRYGPEAAAALGLTAQLAFRCRAEPHARGALNLYFVEAHELTVETQQLGAMLAHLSAVALGWSRLDQSLHEALTTRELIGQAVGILMERYTIDADRAFSFLVRTSQSTNVKVREVAAGLIAEQVPPGGRDRPAGARSGRGDESSWLRRGTARA